MSRVSAGECRAGLFMRHMLLNSSGVYVCQYRENPMPLRCRDARHLRPERSKTIRCTTAEINPELDITRAGRRSRRALCCLHKNYRCQKLRAIVLTKPVCIHRCRHSQSASSTWNAFLIAGLATHCTDCGSLSSTYDSVGRVPKDSFVR